MKQAAVDDDIDGMLVVYAPPTPSFEATMGPAIVDAAEGSAKPVVAVMIGSGDGWVAGHGSVPSFSFPEQAVAALASSLAYGRRLETDASEAPTEPRSVDPSRAGALVSSWLAAQDDPQQSVQLDIEATAELLSTYSITVATAREASPENAAAVAAEIGFPVAVKSTKRSSGRSARAGVGLDLGSSDEVTEAVATMVDALGDDARTLIVQQMIPPGVDIRIRCHRDDRLGVIVSVGYGGIDADLIDDRTSRLAPLSPASAAAMLNETKVGDALAAAGLDSSPLVDIIVLAAQLCADQHDVHDLDLNPVIASDGHAIVTDAAIHLVDVPNDDGPLRRLD
jgi:acyl-CoA synthetase (NDP forming)